MNANKDKEVKFLQVWVFPKAQDIAPRYQQRLSGLKTGKTKYRQLLRLIIANSVD